jgi:hypothetical protein
MRKNQFKAGCGEIRRKVMGKAAGKPYNKIAKGFFSCECEFFFGGLVSMQLRTSFNLAVASSLS